MRRRRSALIVGVIIGLFWLAQSAWADHARMSLNIGFGGYVVPGRWTPLRITVDGITEPSMIEIRRHNRPGLTEYYPCPAGPVVLECPVFADPTGEIFNVRLITNGQIVTEQQVKTFDKIFPGHIVLAVQTPAPARQAVSQMLLPGEPVMVVAVALSEMPSAIPDYDSISGLIINDPTWALNPAQKRAIRVWLSGGGRMLIPQPALTGNFDGILPEHSETVSVGRVYQVGLGSLTVVPEGFSESTWSKEAKEWNGIFKLKAYNDSFRLTEGDCFSLSSSEKKKPQPAPTLFWLFPVVWGLFAIVLWITKPQKAFAYISLLTLAGLLTALPVGWLIEQHWHRGAVAVTRVLIIPSGDGLYDSYVQLPRTGVWDLSGLKSSPWEVSILAGREAEGSISLRPSGDPQVNWRHRTDVSEMVLATSAGQSLRWIGWIPKGVLKRSLGRYRAEDNRGSITLWMKGEWKIPQETQGVLRWKKVARCPRWLMEEREWCLRLTRWAPERPWLFGRGELGGLDLRLQGEPDNTVIWAKPLFKEGKS